MDHLGMSPEELKDVIQDVRQRYPSATFPDIKMDNVFHGMQKADSDIIKGRKAIVLTMDDKRVVSGICSEQYMLIPHEWAVWRFEQVLDTPAFLPFGQALIHPNIMGTGGAKMRLQATFPDAEVKIGEDDVRPRAGIKNSLDLSLEWEPWFGGMVKRCTNGLLMYGNLIEGGAKHKMSLNLEENINRLVEGVEMMDEMFHIWDTWTKKKLTQSQAMEMLEESPLSEKQVEKIAELPEIGTNMTLKGQQSITPWFLNSVVTQYIEHEMENTPARMITEEKVTNFLTEAFEEI